MAEDYKIVYPVMSHSVIAIVGGFGSGKTEVAVNMGKYLVASQSLAVTLADLDLVNPYFRSREAQKELENLGIKVIAPKDGQFYADLPILLPEIKGAIKHPGGTLILDVGGDAQGTRALGSLSDEFDPEDYDMFMVLNSRRPQTSDVAGSVATMKRIEQKARLKFTGLVSNTHMLDDTDLEIVREGYRMAREVGRQTGLPVVFVSMNEALLAGGEPGLEGSPVLPLSRSMLKPWETGAKPTDRRGEIPKE